MSIALYSLAVLLIVGLTVSLHQGQGRLAYWIAQLPVTMPVKRPNGQIGYAEAQVYTINGFTYGVPKNGDEQAAISAIQAAGTNALPYLIAELGSRDSRVKLWSVAAIQRCGYSPPPAFLRPRTGSRLQALTALRVLGTNASPALPSLEELTHSKDPGVEAAARLVIQSLTSSNRWSILF